MRADVAKPRCAEQCIAQRMREHVPVGMPDRAFVKGQFDAANNEFSPFG